MEDNIRQSYLTELVEDDDGEPMSDGDDVEVNLADDDSEDV